MSRTYPPFLVAPANAIEPLDWLLAYAGEAEPLPDRIERWDPQTTLRLSCTVTIDRSAVLAACQLGPSTELTVATSAHSTRTGAETVVGRVQIDQTDSPSQHHEVVIPGESLGGQLTLRTMLCVMRADCPSPLAPSRPGSVIWDSSRRVALEGVGGQFPTETVDFAVVRPEARAAGWDFQIDTSDPGATFIGAARLLLNSAHPGIRRLTEGARDPATKQLERALQWDITRRLITAALNMDEVMDLAANPDADTVAEVLRCAVARVWPGESPRVIRRWWEHDPGRIEREIQSATGFPIK